MVCNCGCYNPQSTRIPQSARIDIARNFPTHEKQLIAFIEYGDVPGVRRKLAAGARVNGCRNEEYRPIITAVKRGNLIITKLLLKEGADPDSAIPKDELASNGDILNAAGSRPLHVAAQDRNIDVSRLLVRAGASINTPDANGMTPLMAVLKSSPLEVQKDWQDRVVLVRELLAAGADATLRDKHGSSAAQYASALEDPEPLKMIVWKIPEAINFVDADGETPLFVAARFGRVRTVSQLLALGAHQPAPHFRSCKCGCSNAQCPLRVAAGRGHLDVVHILIDAVESIGGLEATIPSAMQVTCTSASDAYSASGKNQGRWTKILKVLLDVEGEDRQENWARSMFSHFPVLHHAVVFGTLATISVLLAAGADETDLNCRGETASEVMCEAHGGRPKDPAEKAATFRMLARGPAFRARSWVWPGADVDEGEDEDEDGADNVEASPRGSGAPTSALGVRIWRSSTSRKYFVRLIRR